MLFNEVGEIVEDVLQVQLGVHTQVLGDAVPLHGAIPQLDSMAVVTIIAVLEERFGFSMGDSEIDAETFATLASLTAFVERKIAGR